MALLEKKRALALPLAVAAALVTFLVFLPAVFNGFVRFDDNLYVYENTAIRVFDFDLIRWAFSSVVVGNWHPVTMLSHAADLFFFGLDPRGHHLVSVLLHSLNTFLVFILNFRLIVTALEGKGGQGGADNLLRALSAALITALLFGIHPMRVESVAWVSERKDLLSALFYMLSILAYLGFAGKSSKRAAWYALSLFLFLLALMSKPMAVSLPFVLVLIDFYPLKRLSSIRAALTEKLPFFAASALMAAVTVMVQRHGGALAAKADYPLYERLYVSVRGFGFYIYKMLFPVKLAPVYPYPIKAELFSFSFIGPLLFVILMSLLAILLVKKSRLYISLWAYYLVTLIPVIGIVQVGSQSAADRYSYLPGVALFLFAGLLFSKFFLRFKALACRATLTLVALAVIAVFCALTVNQSSVWKDDMSLWNHEIEIYPLRLPMPYSDRGSVYLRRGEFELALKDFNTGISINPNIPTIYNNRAVTYRRMGAFKEAMADLNRAIELNPKYHTAYNSRGVLFMKLKEFARALDDFKLATKFKPEYARAHTNKGVAHAKLGLFDEALKDHARTLKLTPWSAEAHYNLAVAYKNTGDMDTALTLYRRAAEMGSEPAIRALSRTGR